MSDHDLVIRMDTRLEDLISSVKELQNGTYSKIEILFRDKAERKDVEVLQKIVNDDMEKRMRCLESSIVDKKYYSDKHDQLQKQIDDLIVYKATVEGKASQSAVYWAYLFSAAGLLIGLIDFLLKK